MHLCMTRITAAAGRASFRAVGRGYRVAEAAEHPVPSFRGLGRRVEVAFRAEEQRKVRVEHPVPLVPLQKVLVLPLRGQHRPVRVQHRASAVRAEADPGPQLVRFRDQECCPGSARGEFPPI